MSTWVCAQSFPRSLGLPPALKKRFPVSAESWGEVVAEMTACGEPIPEALAEKNYSGRFMVRVPSLVHRRLATEAADLGVSINRLVSAKLALS